MRTKFKVHSLSIRGAAMEVTLPNGTKQTAAVPHLVVQLVPVDHSGEAGSLKLELSDIENARKHFPSEGAIVCADWNVLELPADAVPEPAPAVEAAGTEE